MIGFVARFIGLWLVAGGLVALVIDAAKSIAASSLVLTQLGTAWFTLSPDTLVAVQQFVQETAEARVGAWLWDPLIVWILMLPTWAVFGGLGFLLTYLGRRRRLDPGYA